MVGLCLCVVVRRCVVHHRFLLVDFGLGVVCFDEVGFCGLVGDE